MKCQDCKKNDAVVGYCTTCYAFKLMEDSPWNVPPWTDLQSEMKQMKEQLKILTRTILTKKGVKDLKKQQNIEELYQN